MNPHQSLRIALFFSSNPTSAGGVQEHIFHLSQELRKMGHDITIFGPHGNSKKYKNYKPIGYTIQVPLPNGNWTSIQMIQPFINLDKLFTKKKFDILHIHEPYIPILGWQMVNTLQLPKVTTFHAAWDNNSVVSAIDNIVPLFRDKFSERMNAAIFVSRITQKRWAGLCTDTVSQHIIYNAVDRDLFHGVPKKTGARIRLLFLGRIVSRKGIMHLLKAFKMLIPSHPQTQLDIVGSGAEVDNVTYFIKKNHLEKNVKYLGEITGTKRVALYQKADIFCAPYSDEASPLTILEAMSCGCTIVGFQNEAVKESLHSYPFPELLVTQKDVNALAQALKKAITDKQLRKTIYFWSTEESKKYSWSSVASETEKIYHQILKN